MVIDTDTSMFVVGSAIFGWLCNTLYIRFTRQTDIVVPEAIKQIGDKIDSIAAIVHKMEITIEGIKNGFVTRDKMDEKIAEVERKNKESYLELKTKIEHHIDDREVHR